MALEHEILALRTATALVEADHVACVRVSGPAAFEAVDRVCPIELTLQDAQMKPSLLLTERGLPFADLLVCRDDESFFLLAEGPTPAELEAYLRAGFPPGAEVTIERLDETHRVLGLHGPYAWELCAAFLGPDLPGMPYLSLLRTEGVICFRSGKTGEYGYDLLVPAAEAAQARARIEELGRAFDLAHASLEALDQCALENWFFNVRREGRAGLSPLELGLQWRVSYLKDYPGAAALAEMRRRGPRRRLVCVLGAGPMAEGDRIALDGEPIGTVVNAGFSPTRADFAAAAIVDLPYAAAGVGRYAVEHDGARSPVRTVSPPVINNRSLYVSPQRHGYAGREGDVFPPLVRRA
jgi:glycine cleavage system aminomethyltransferase T